MEDIRAYIESGILELYVLGDVSPGERLQVEEMAQKHPAVKAELDEIERSLESYALENAVEPSENLRDRVMGSILTNFGDDNNFPERPQHVNQKVVELTSRKENNFYKYAFAACLALLIASTIALVSVYSHLQQSNSQLEAMQLQNQHFSNRVNLMDRELGVFRDPSFKLLKLQGTAKTPASVVTVAFSAARKKVMIDMGNIKLPENDKDHQYQLWALVGGKPVDLGVFDARNDSTGMKEMKSIALADAFAVTLEPKGGSVNPTMDQMVVLGKF